jgi:hypothetical protein
MDTSSDQTPMYLLYIVVGSIITLAVLEVVFRGVE